MALIQLTWLPQKTLHVPFVPQDEVVPGDSVFAALAGRMAENSYL